MQIDGIILNVELIDIIKELKFQLAQHGVYRFEKMFDSGDDLMICCPYHKNGQERKPSAGIRKSDGTFHCLACGETKSLTEMISDCLGYHDKFGKQGYKWLMSNFASVEVKERGKLVVNLSRGNNVDVPDVVSPTISDEELDKYRYIHPYMYERGLNDGVIELFDLGFDKSTNSITFPVRDANGDCLFVARRTVVGKRFDIPQGVNKPLYGYYEVSQHAMSLISGKTVYVCEGLFDCLRLWCNGKYAVAGFGCLFNSYQIKQLQDLPCRTIVLAFDNDKAGEQAAKRLRKLITNKIIKEVVLPEGRKDVGECTDEEIQNLKEVF